MFKDNIFHKYGFFAILILAGLLRLYQLDAPLIGVHSWRQADTAAMARNYHEQGYRFLYPQIDWGGDSPGYVETEFPLYPFTVAWLYKLFGVSEAWGRLLSLCCSLGAVYFLYRLVRETVNPAAALWSAFFLAILPTSIFYSRVFMVEPHLLLCSAGGVFFFWKWTRDGRWSSWGLSAAFVALAGLLKIPTLYLGLPLLFLAWQKFGSRTLLSWRLWLYALLILGPVAAWYYHAHQVFLQYGITFGIWEYGTDKWGNWGLVFSLGFWKQIIFTSLAEQHLTWLGFPLFLLGLGLPRRTKTEGVFDVWLLALLVYVVIVAKGNYVHDYYQWPLVLPAVVFMGKAADWLGSHPRLSGWGRVLPALWILALVVMSLGRYQGLLRQEDFRNDPKWELGRQVERLTEKEALVVAVDRGDPTLLYLSHRKGWHANPDQLNEHFIKDRRDRGARYLVGIYEYFQDPLSRDRIVFLKRHFPSVYSSPRAFIFKIG